MSLIHEHPQCPYCLKRFHVNGIGNHKRTCKQRIEQDIVDSQFNLEQGPSQAANTAQEAANTPRLLFNNQVPSNTGLDSRFKDLQLDSQRDLASSPSFEPGSSEDENESSSDDDIIDAANVILDLVNPYNPKFCIEYHPSAILDPCILTHEEYFQITAVEMTGSFIDKPWHPFASENDFELAELILHTGMNHQERDSYFKVLKTQAGDHQSAYTINNESDLNDAWSQAEHLLVMLDEKTNTRMWIFDEPWTGDLLWKVQSSLPPGGKPLAYILYADKTHLSSFGTAKGYPVMAHIANLPDAIRNGKGWGGGTVVGWLPIVEEDPKHKGKPSWINFKRVVWHESFCKILESVAEYSYTGYAFTLPQSGETIVIYPFILILSADYEEHCMMTLICGKYIHYEQQKTCRSFMIRHKKREIVFYNHLVYEMWKMYSGALSKVIHIEQFLGIDCMHIILVFSSIFFYVYWSMWRIYKDLINQILFAAHSVLSKADNPSAYLLLKVIRSYLELDMYTSMDVHTEKSIEEGRQLLGVFEANLKAYSQATHDIVWKNVTSWSIPKGVTKNYNTKVNECMHGPLKEAYQTWTNFKNVADQILMTDHRYGIAMKLQQRMDHNKKHQKEAMASVEQETKVSSKAKHHNRQMQNIQPLDSKASLHSLWFTPRDPHTLEELEAAFHSDPAYEHFQICLGLFMTTFLNMVEKGTVAAGKYIQYRPNDMSLINFKKSTDLLRCSPSFYNHPRYDGVIINTDEGVYIGRLVQLFECEYLEQRYPLALVHPFDITVTDGRQHWKH
ncbi:hypothetical protein EDD18DRAFT_1113786 [Armillaria luteobubalina]|uniref:Uncharacterized protein n=1 Tax=Armillaria luteobubalina TaxID=153913 RepID=A0AA39P8A3_9AGAR|nr:hypothetical protein EDD18DRAFT_1113786 [Armillaria luteobubalina]